MARPRFNGQGFTNPINPLGLNAESRHRVNPQLSGAFMSNETQFEQNVSPTPKAQPVIYEAKGKAVAGFFGKIGSRIGSGFRKITGRGSGKSVRGVLGKGGKSNVTDLSGNLLKKGAKGSVDDIAEKSLNPLTKSLIKTGGWVVVGGFGVFGGYLLGDKFLESVTGLDCPQKAEDAGYEQGTDEYTQYVEECQAKAGMTMALIGTGVLVVGGLVLLKIVLPKKKDADEDDE